MLSAKPSTRQRMICPVPDSRQTQALGKEVLCRVPGSRQTWALGKECQGANGIHGRHLCRVPAVRHSAKELPRGRLWGHQVGWILPSAMWPALGKRPLCRVPALALGKKIYFFYFGRQFCCEAFLQYHDQHVQIWHIFSTFCYIFYFISIC